MSKFCGAHRAPRAGIDVIDAAPAALAVVQLAMSTSPVAETIVLVLDEARRGRSVIVVDGTADPDAVRRSSNGWPNRSPRQGSPAPSSSPPSGRAPGRSPVTPTAGSKPVSWPTTSASS